MPSDMPMPSPNAISPSGLKSTSQFYSSYEGSNPRRRPAQDPIGKIVKKCLMLSVEHSQASFQSVFMITSPAEILKCFRNLNAQFKRVKSV